MSAEIHEFASTEEAIEWGKENIEKHCCEPIKINGEKYLLCCDSRVYEGQIWGFCYEILERHAAQVGKQNLPEFYSPEDLASELRDKVINFIEEVSGVKYLDVWDEY